MTQEEKQLLLADLCARLPYKVICNASVRSNNTDISSISNDYYLTHNLLNYIWIDYYKLKPYLRSISSMTEEEEKELNNILPYSMSFSITVNEELMLNTDNEYDSDHYFSCFVDVQDWLNSHYFDYRGLIKKGLALPATEETYSIK